MSSLVSTEVLAGVLVGVVVLMVGLISLLVWNTLQIRRMSKTSYQEGVVDAKEEAAAIMSQARAEAKSMLAEANEEGARTMARAGHKAKITNLEYQEELKNLIDRYHAELEATTKRGDETFARLSSAAADSFNRRQEELNSQFDDVLESLSKVANTLNDQTTTTMESLEGAIDETMKKMELMLQEGEGVVKAKVAEHLTKLLDRAQADVDEYKKARLTLLDSHIERLIEDITVRVLHKKLDLDEHGELALQALKEAKEHNVL